MEVDGGPSTSYGGALVNAMAQSGAVPQGDAQSMMLAVKNKLRNAASNIIPAIFKRRSGEAAILFDMGIRVPDWQTIKRMRGGSPRHMSGNLLARVPPRVGAMNMQQRHMENTMPVPRPPSSVPMQPQLNPMPKLSRAIKSKSNGAGRTYTSKFRGVHQTFPTKRWEAQFRRNGKPTSLGCFDHEEEAARAYDKMMLWCELHNTAGVKGGITNYDPSEYEKDIAWLQQVTQDELIEALRSDGRRQAAHRMLRQKREGAPSGGRNRGRGQSRDAMSEHDSGDMGRGRAGSVGSGDDSGM